MQGQPPMQSMQPMHPPPTSQGMDGSNTVYASMNQMYDQYDPMLDADPFGLTASMHFPTQFTFQESSMRQWYSNPRGRDTEHEIMGLYE